MMDLEVYNPLPKQERPVSLISIKKLINVGCKETYDENRCYVEYNDVIVRSRVQDPNLELWIMPLTEHLTEFANSANHLTSKADVLNYLHQALFCLSKATLLQSRKRKNFCLIP